MGSSEFFKGEWVALEVLTVVTVAMFAIIAYAVLTSTAIT
jgi:hypothetical protein